MDLSTILFLLLIAAPSVWLTLLVRRHALDAEFEQREQRRTAEEEARRMRVAGGNVRSATRGGAPPSQGDS